MRSTLHAFAILPLMALYPEFAAAKTDGRPCPPEQIFDIAEEIERTIGFPVEHFDLTDEEGRLHRICSERLCLRHHSGNKAPIWVIARLNRSIVCGSNPRPEKWKKEDRFESSEGQMGATENVPVAKNSDYTGSGFARGHQAASADFQSNVRHM